mmetsp:Transcript_47513/g.110775  ORF Transcript_47513/g.110775 Transcript_47513/m.110775 type:complete len:698 (-) Transcript_47513:105-2198(-)
MQQNRSIKLVHPQCPPEPLFELNAHSLEQLRSLDGPLYVISVVGDARHGKSYIAGLLIGEPDAFKIGHTTTTCTKGIDMCVVPRTGGGYWVLLDVEGTKSTDRDATYDASLMTIAMLLSSVVVYNCMSIGTQGDVERLMLLSGLMQKVVDKAGDGVIGMDRHFPALVWLLRDFQFQMVDAAGQPCDAATYLEDILLASQPGATSTARQRNRALNDIKTTFLERMLLTLPRPVVREADFEFVHTRALPAFVDGAIQVAQVVRQCVKPKVFEGSQVTGAILGALAQQYVRTVDEEGVPEVATAWQQVCQGENARAWTRALAMYTQQWEAQELPVDNPAVIHEALFQQCLQLHSRIACSVVEGKLESLTAALEDEFRVWEEASNAAAKSQCQACLQSALDSVSAGLRQGRFSCSGGLAAFDAAVAAALGTFQDTAEATRFPDIADMCASAWMEENRSMRAAIRRADESLDESLRAADEARQRAAHEQLAHAREMERMRQELERQKRHMQEQQVAYEEGMAKQKHEEEEYRRLQDEENKRRTNELRLLMQKQQEEQAKELKEVIEAARKAKDEHVDRMTKAMQESRKQHEVTMRGVQAAVEQARQAVERQEAQTQEAVRRAQSEMKNKDNSLLRAVAGLTMGFFPTCAPLIGAITTAATAGEVLPRAISIPGASGGSASSAANSSSASRAAPTATASSAWA